MTQSVHQLQLTARQRFQVLSEHCPSFAEASVAFDAVGHACFINGWHVNLAVLAAVGGCEELRFVELTVGASASVLAAHTSSRPEGASNQGPALTEHRFQVPMQLGFGIENPTTETA